MMKVSGVNTYHDATLPSFRVAEILSEYFNHPLHAEDAPEDARKAHIARTAASLLALLLDINVNTS
jgi:hypothetical protein